MLEVLQILVDSCKQPHKLVSIGKIALAVHNIVHYLLLANSSHYHRREERPARVEAPAH